MEYGNGVSGVGEVRMDTYPGSEPKPLPPGGILGMDSGD